MSAAAALELGPKLLAIVGVVACCVTALSCCILLAVMRNDKRRPLPRRAKEQEQEGLTRPSGGIGLSGNDEAPALGCCGSFLAALKTPPAYSWRQQADESAETVKYFLGCQTVLWIISSMYSPLLIMPVLLVALRCVGHQQQPPHTLPCSAWSLALEECRPHVLRPPRLQPPHSETRPLLFRVGSCGRRSRPCSSPSAASAGREGAGTAAGAAAALARGTAVAGCSTTSRWRGELRGGSSASLGTTSFAPQSFVAPPSTPTRWSSSTTTTWTTRRATTQQQEQQPALTAGTGPWRISPRRG
mmetsp:Transcript_19798/g.58928  ORF Transcript_19798/g.58928 Transcript_19798/m.58928 type:complete len:301 (-) Transcript_19798:255-1157(-)